LEALQADKVLTANKTAKEGLDEMAILFSLLEAYGVLNKISFDLSLARGLDYYTGLIYEAVVAASAPPGTNANALAGSDPTSTQATSKPKKKPTKSIKTADGVVDDDDEIDESSVGIGSIAAGGRYDNLVSSLLTAAAGEGKKSFGVPCVGISIGLDRIFAILYPKWQEKHYRQKDILAYVMAAGDGLLTERVKLVSELRQAGIKTDFLAKTKPKLPTQFSAGERDEVPFAIILGQDELKQGFVTVKEQRWELKDGVKSKIKTAEDERGKLVERAKLAEYLKGSQILKDWSAGILS